MPRTQKARYKGVQVIIEKKDIHTDSYSTEEQLYCFKEVKQVQESSNDPITPIDVFSVKGKLREWVGLSN